MTPALPALEHHQIPVAGGALHVVTAGPASGPPVVLLHGFPETWWSWRHQLGPLAAAGLRVIAPDLRGYGASTRRGPFDLGTLARDVVQVIDTLAARPVVVVGHDWGGGTAWHLAQHHPEVVSRLVVLNCPLPHVLEEQLTRRPRLSQIRRSWYIYFFQLPLVAEWLIGRHDAGNVIAAIRGSAVDKRHLGADELAPMRDAARPFAARRAMLGPYRAALRGVLARGLRPAPGVIVQAPTWLVWGLGDPALGFDDLVPGTERWVPTLEVVPLPGVGHFPQCEAPERVNTLLLAVASGT